MVCKVPFTEVEIHANGDAYVCCPAKMSAPIGNVYESPFEEVWHSAAAKVLRKEMLCGNYRQCNLEICNPGNNIEQDKLALVQDLTLDLGEAPPFPVYVKFCHDFQCNIACITCRDALYGNSRAKQKELDDRIESVFLPILRNCHVVSMNGSGEAFASQHCRNLIKAINATYPHMLYDLHTNGVLCSKENCDRLGITDKLVSIDISLHAARKETYDRILVGSNFEKVTANLQWLASLKRSGQLKRLDLYFVVQQMNYREMTEFARYAEGLGADAYFWEWRDWGTLMRLDYDRHAIFEKWHPEFNAFATLLQDPVLHSGHCHLNNFLGKVRPISEEEHQSHIRQKRNRDRRHLYRQVFSVTRTKQFKFIKLFGFTFRVRRAAKKL